MEATAIGSSFQSGPKRGHASLAMFSVVLTVFLTILVAATPQARANSDADIVWTASKVRGTVNFREGGEGLRWHPLHNGSLLSSFAQLRTGPDGHAELTYQDSTIVAAPNSEFQLPGPVPTNAVYRVAQRLGTFLYKIKHATRDKFEVQTPYLTTVIKGTIFTVQAGPSGSSVHVTEGAVFVRPSSGNGGTFVRPGQTALINSVDRDRVILQGGTSSPGSSPAPTGEKRSEVPASEETGGKAAAQPSRRGKAVKIVFRDITGQAASLTDPVLSTDDEDEENIRDRVDATGDGIGADSGLVLGNPAGGIGGTSAGTGGTVTVGLGGGSIGASAGTSIGGGGINVGIGANVGGLGVGINAGVGGGGIGVGAGVSVGGSGVSAGTGTGSSGTGGSGGGLLGGLLGGLQ